MAKYTINYACGHGSHVEQLYGKSEDRERRIEWEEANRVCPDCYKAQRLAADEAAPAKATIRPLCNGAAVKLRVEVAGKVERNKDALAALGIKRRPKSGGFMDMMSSREKWFCGLEIAIESPDEFVARGMALQESLAKLGYEVTADMDPMSVDLALAIEFFRSRDAKLAARAAAVAAVAETDPKPAACPWQVRTRKICNETGGKWPAKFYGRPGCWCMYIADTKYPVSDEEYAGLTARNKAVKEWQARHPELATA
jgi:hypothetical protein